MQNFSYHLLSRALCLLCLSAFSFTTAAQKADLILFNGKIFTADIRRGEKSLFVEAMAVRGNTITAIGRSVDIKKMANAKTRKIDLKGRTVIPGFNDAHEHLGWNAGNGNTYEFVPGDFKGPEKKAVIDSLRKLVSKTARGQWIYGSIGLGILEDKSFRQGLLDSIVPDHPVVLQTFWGHGLIANSLAFARIGASQSHKDIRFDWFERNSDGSTTGLVHEYGQWPFWESIIRENKAVLITELQTRAKEMVAYGVTTVQQMNSYLTGEEANKIFKEIQLPFRIRLIPMMGTTTNGFEVPDVMNDTLDQFVYTSGIKYMIDGVPPGSTALTSTQYPHQHGWYGRLNMPVELMDDIFSDNLKSGNQLCLHIGGDSAATLALQAMSRAGTEAQWRIKRVRLEHNAIRLNETNTRAVEKFNIMMMHTPQYARRSKLRSLVENGINVGVAPDGLLNPFTNIKIMISEQSDPGENLTREQAIIAYTFGNAFAERKEHVKGTLTPGKLADFAILTGDVFTLPLQQLEDIRSEVTFVDGKVVFERNAHGN